ncbi:MAG TPA: TlpA disulfide reductase family protein [Flavisolibacter sp.]|nr:TlpA disulfide reductase family protein [Flavisolibacter sp.]
MTFKQMMSKSFLRKAGNYIFFGLLLLLLFNPNAKAWLLRQVMATGLFNAGFKKEASVVKQPSKLGAFNFRNEKGNIVSSTDLKGKVVFINFWATWCPPCRAEMPALNDLYNQFHKDDRLVFLFLNEDDDPAKASAYLQSNGFAMPLLSISGGVPSEIYSGSLPTTVVLNKEGQIVYKHEGIAKYNTMEFIKQLKDLL